MTINLGNIVSVRDKLSAEYLGFDSVAFENLTDARRLPAVSLKLI